jgi:hypothetical protein
MRMDPIPRKCKHSPPVENLDILPLYLTARVSKGKEAHAAVRNMIGER